MLLAKVGIVRFQCIGLTFGLIATSVNRLKKKLLLSKNALLCYIKVFLFSEISIINFKVSSALGKDPLYIAQDFVVFFRVF